MINANKNVMLYAENLSASYNEKRVFSDITFEAFSGELVCLIGPNGSGKSTLLKLLAGIGLNDLQSFGNIFVGASNLQSLSRQEKSLNISYMSQHENNVWDFLVKDCILAGRFAYTSWSKWYSKKDKDLVEQAMGDLDILHLANRSIHSLSGGEMQRVRIARSIVQSSPVLLLDEPVANLDIGCQNTILNKLKTLSHNNNTCIVIAIHDLNSAAMYADRVVLLHPFRAGSHSQGQLLSGSPKELFTSDILCNAYNADIKVFEHPVFNCPQVYVSR